MDNEFYVVESILKQKRTKNGTMYLVKWKGYPKNQSTWEPEDHLIYLQNGVAVDQVGDQQIQVIKKNKKSKKKSSKKKSNSKKIQEFLNDKRTIKIEDEDITPIQQNLFYKIKREETACTNKKIGSSEPKKSASNEKIKIMSRQLNEHGEYQFFLKTSDRIRQMSDLQVKARYPTELCIYYENIIKKHLQQYNP